VKSLTDRARKCGPDLALSSLGQAKINGSQDFHMISCYNLANGSAPFPYRSGILVPQIPSREYASSLILVTVRHAAQDIRRAMLQCFIFCSLVDRKENVGEAKKTRERLAQI
jgi:hypothetical protein